MRFTSLSTTLGATFVAGAYAGKADTTLATVYFDGNCTIGGAPLMEAGKVPGLRYSIKAPVKDLIIYSDYDCTKEATFVQATHCGHIGTQTPWSPIDCVKVV